MRMMLMAAAIAATAVPAMAQDASRASAVLCRQFLTNRDPVNADPKWTQAFMDYIVKSSQGFGLPPGNLIPYVIASCEADPSQMFSLAVVSGRVDHLEERGF